MKDIPVFTSPHGVASLILREIPTRGEAFVLIRGVFDDLPALAEDCLGFCRALDARAVYFSGEPELFSDCERWAVYARLLERSLEKSALPPARAVLRQARNREKWLSLYRQRFAQVPLAPSDPGEGLLWYADLEGRTVGLGQTLENTIRVAASLCPGGGRETVCALGALCPGPRIRLLCAAENLKAMQLYDKLSFDSAQFHEIWYRLK